MVQSVVSSCPCLQLIKKKLIKWFNYKKEKRNDEKVIKNAGKFKKLTNVPTNVQFKDIKNVKMHSKKLQKI